MALIDRESLLEKFQFRIEPFGVEGATIKKCVEMARDIIMDEPVVKDTNVPSWIPVTERLPEHEDPVLCFIKNGQQDILQLDKFENLWVGMQWTYKRHAVTHWMPLPEPPKED